MKPQRIGILHPGAMGISIAASAQNSGHQVHWASEGRGSATQERAAKFGLHDVRALAELCSECPILISVCPPHAAEDVANRVRETGFNGLYLDANAISPERTIRIGQAMTAADISFVDGGIIGEPAWKPGTTWLYLAGLRAAEIAGCFSSGPLETNVLGATIGNASALKMCFAAYTKGSVALLCAILGTAESLGVREALQQQWKRDDPDFPENVSKRIRNVTGKAWRFVGEMEEISSTFRDAGLPGEFHAAAAVIYRRLAQFKDSQTPPSLEDILGALLQTENELNAAEGRCE
jgi:3-hydroxyisobutyrate dehydrogenase-like beta-hydroxyacid dehydrogenase